MGEKNQDVISGCEEGIWDFWECHEEMRPQKVGPACCRTIFLSILPAHGYKVIREVDVYKVTHIGTYISSIK